jgi:serine/threonine protein phosphatase PrpC
MKLDIGYRTDPGPQYDHNEDTVLVSASEDSPGIALLMVADGMGGAKAGELASQEAVRVIRQRLLEQPPPTSDTAAARLREAIEAANQSIYQKGSGSPELEGMGSTVVLALIIDDTFWVAHVGDSRAYLVRGEIGYRLTQDHTWKDEQVRKGLLTQEQADNLNIDHVLDRALGPQSTVETEIASDEYLEIGDTLILCSDGLHGVLDDQEIVLTAAKHSPQEAANLLMERALDVPATDNVSVIVVRAENAD